MKRYLSGLILVGAALATGCHSNEAAKPSTVETVRARVVTSSQEQVSALLHAIGTVHAKQSATISAQVMGRVQQVLVREGDQVRAGQTLVILDGAALDAQAAGAKAAVAAAESAEAAARSNASLASSTLTRFRQLEAEKSVSAQEMDEVARRAEGANAQLEAARSQSEAARQQAAAARAMQGYTRLVAPFAGVVTARMVDPGAMAAPGVPLVQIDQTGPLELQATIDESAIASVRVGMKAPVTIDGVSQPLSGAVAQILPAADAASHSFTVKIGLPASNQARAGMYGAVDIAKGSTNAILAARSAIVIRGSLECAYVLDAQGIAQLRYITLGAAHGDRVEILSGLAAGERLVDAPGDREIAGKRIEVQP